jgi:hypothetical protein
VSAFTLWHTVLGQIIGETIGYALTAVFTVLTAHALGRVLLPRWVSVLGYLSAGLIATGVLVPVLGAASLTNFAGYVLWCAWLIILAVVLFRIPAYAGESGDRTTDVVPGVLA